LTITKEQILEEARIYRSLTNDISDSWHKVLQWKHISQAELSRRTGITEKSIRLIVTGQSIASIDNLVLICLAANLPGEISEQLIKLSGHTLMLGNEEHAIYNFILRHKYSASLSEIRQFLCEIGSDLYLKIPIYS